MGTELGRAAFALLFGGAGIFLFYLATLLVLRRGKWKREGIVVEGRVVGLRERIARSSRPARSTFAPIVSFEMDGNAVRFTSSQSDTARAYEVGETVMVRY